jgi:hypothetical protein
VLLYGISVSAVKLLSIESFELRTYLLQDLVAKGDPITVVIVQGRQGKTATSKSSESHQPHFFSPFLSLSYI